MNHHNKCTWLHSPVLDQRMSHFKNPTTCYLLETQTKKQTQTKKLKNVILERKMEKYTKKILIKINWKNIEHVTT